jgi:hypothetical protein
MALIQISDLQTASSSGCKQLDVSDNLQEVIGGSESSGLGYLGVGLGALAVGATIALAPAAAPLALAWVAVSQLGYWGGVAIGTGIRHLSE